MSFDEASAPDFSAAIDRIPFARHLGVEKLEFAKDRIVSRMRVKPECCNPTATLHGAP